MQKIRDYARATDKWPQDNLRNAVGVIASCIDDLIFDISTLLEEEEEETRQKELAELKRLKEKYEKETDK